MNIHKNKNTVIEEVNGKNIIIAGSNQINDSSNNFFLLPPSSFLIIGLFIWFLRSWKTEQVEPAEFKMSKNAPKEVKADHA